MNARRLKQTGICVAFFILLAAAASRAADHEVIFLWPSGAPGSEGKAAEEVTRITAEGEHVVSSVNRPSITVYLPSKENATGAAVIVVPGGGHAELWMDHEGYNVAKWLSDRGVASFVLKYRLAREKGSTYTIEGDALRDIQRAIRLVRSRAVEWGVDPDRIGVMAFSAGGQLAALAATRYDAGIDGATNPIDHQSSKPAFQALVYPGPLRDVHIELSALSKDAPPAFLLGGEDDRPDMVQGLAEYYLALKRAGASAELHVYTHVGHGFGLRSRNTGPITAWPDRFLDWMSARGLLKSK